MGVSYSVQESHRLKDLFEERLDQFDRKATIIVHLDDFVKWFAQRLENQTIVSVVVEGVNITYETLFIVFVSCVDLLQDILFNFGRTYIPMDWPNDLNNETIYFDCIFSSLWFGLHDSAKSSLTHQFGDFIHITQYFSNKELVMTLLFCGERALGRTVAGHGRVERGFAFASHGFFVDFRLTDTSVIENKYLRFDEEFWVEFYPWFHI